MTEAFETFTLSMPSGRAHSSLAMNCQTGRWLGGHDALISGAVEYSPKTVTAKRNTPGSLSGGLT